MPLEVLLETTSYEKNQLQPWLCTLTTALYPGEPRAAPLSHRCHYVSDSGRNERLSWGLDYRLYLR